MTDEISRRKSIEIVQNKLKDRDLSEEQAKRWSAVFLTMDTSGREIYNTLRAEEAYDIAHLLQASSQINALAKLLHAFPPPVSLSVRQLQQWARWKFDAMVVLGSSDNIHDAAMHLLELTQDITTYRRIKNAAPAFRVEDFGSFSADLHADILAEENAWDTLIEWLKEKNELPALARHAVALHYQLDDAAEIFASIVIAYADAHVGPSTLEHITRLLDTLKEAGFQPTATMLSHLLADAFPDRFEAFRKTGRVKRRHTAPLVAEDDEE